MSGMSSAKNVPGRGRFSGQEGLLSFEKLVIHYFTPTNCVKYV